jgi:3-oxoacyl-[acyl-carrier-protein] synthase III
MAHCISETQQKKWLIFKQSNMAFQEIHNVKIVGLSACVPKRVEENESLSFFEKAEDYQRFVTTTGIERRHVIEKGTCTSDLCYEAAVKLMAELGWENQEVDCLLFVSQTPDYILPATACILQDRLGLSKDCMAFDVSMGCSGWIYGVTTIASLVSHGSIRKALLLAGDTVTLTKSPRDKSTYPLFGDAATATAFIYEEGASGIKSSLYTDGARHNAIMIKDGGCRYPVTEQSFVEKNYEGEIVRNDLQSILDGASVFTFGLSKAPECVNLLLDHFKYDKEAIDYYIFHQANLLMNEKIRTKLKLPKEKVPYILKDFGNTSSASIPLTMVVALKEQLENRSLSLIACGFGVGLSWGALFFETESIVCCELLIL